MEVNTSEINRKSTIHFSVEKSKFKTAKSAFQKRNFTNKNNNCLKEIFHRGRVDFHPIHPPPGYATAQLRKIVPKPEFSLAHNKKLKFF